MEQRLLDLEVYGDAFFDKIETTVDEDHYMDVKGQLMALDKILKSVEEFVETNPIQNLLCSSKSSSSSDNNSIILPSESKMELEFTAEESTNHDSIVHKNITYSSKLCKQRLEELMKNLKIPQ